MHLFVKSVKNSFIYCLKMIWCKETWNNYEYVLVINNCNVFSFSLQTKTSTSTNLRLFFQSKQRFFEGRIGSWEPNSLLNTSSRVKGSVGEGAEFKNMMQSFGVCPRGSPLFKLGHTHLPMSHAEKHKKTCNCSFSRLKPNCPVEPHQRHVQGREGRRWGGSMEEETTTGGAH